MLGIPGEKSFGNKKVPFSQINMRAFSEENNILQSLAEL
jgi:hypothetical protein